METKEFPDELGELKISHEAINNIVSNTTLQIEGVAALATGRLEGLTEMVGMRNLNKGIRIELKNKTISLDIHVIIYFGYRIPEVARAIQKKVKEAIESMTEFNILAINVLVQGIDFRNDSVDNNLNQTE